ncbi:hypothetical protein [Jidongwangia harbinensis]|uniref:hypothetical protein n=1 Tax=Jidongwangia harbinensis TaxID=2878561 RepID=UPI001CD91CEE|nr:hypothetical protein [Jidongwangia harbinensis]MCA2219239.1 hypothetical protein [Jidongwangia harbinensis]
MTGDWADDERLFAALKEALRSAEEVPPRFVEAGKAAYAWYNIDAELADLTYDSSLAGPEPVGAMRAAQDASLRALTYATTELTIEIEITDDAVLGQVLPPQPGTASAQVSGESAVATTQVDEMGFFAIRPVPATAFRLRCVTTSGLDIMTGLIAP